MKSSDHDRLDSGQGLDQGSSYSDTGTETSSEHVERDLAKGGVEGLGEISECVVEL